jgi:hypothetical protein
MHASRPAPGAAAAIAAYAPRSLSPEALGFARAVVARAAAATPARARALLYAAARLAAFGESVGLELASELLLEPAAIERFIVTREGALSPPTRRTLRTNLRALARALSPRRLRCRCRASAPRRPTATPRSPAIWRWRRRSQARRGGCAQAR